MAIKTDVIICGSGSAGICAALWLTKAGISFRLLERRDGPLQIGQADGVQCRTVEVFESFDIVDPLLKEAYHVLELTFWASDRETGRLHRTSRAPDTPRGISHQPHVILNQARVNAMMLDEISRLNPQQSIDYGYTVHKVDVVQDETSKEGFPVQIVAESGGQQHTLRAKYAIGCDGAHSVVRRCLGYKMIGDSSDAVWGVLDIYPETDFPDIRRKCTIHSKAGVLIIIPREGGTLVRFYLQMPPGTVPKQVTLDFLCQHAKDVLCGFHLDIKATYWWSAYSIGQRVADHFSCQSRVFLAGDACHTHSPKAGQGMNTSLQDGYNLGWKLSQVLQGKIKPEVLETYVQERGKVAEDLIRFDHQLNAILESRETDDAADTSSASGMSNGHLQAAHEKFHKYFLQSAKYMAGLTHSYEESLITAVASSQQRLARNVMVGMRMPSAQVIRYCDARAIQLAKVLQADLRWRILVFAGNLTEEDSALRLDRLQNFIASDQSPLLRYTDPAADLDSVIEVILILSGKRTEIEMESIPLVFRPITGKWSITDNHKIFCDDEGYDSSHGHMYDAFGIDKRRGAMIVIRPDQHVACITSLEDYSQISSLFEGFMLPITDSEKPQ